MRLLLKGTVMDELYRLKIKVGPHEFDAEGPADAVREQFKDWKDLIAFAPQTFARLASNASTAGT